MSAGFRDPALRATLADLIRQHGLEAAEMAVRSVGAEIALADERARIAGEQVVDRMADNARALGLDYERG